jgi:hypothetical protein
VRTAPGHFLQRPDQLVPVSDALLEVAEHALKIISLVFEDADPDEGADDGHDALILIDLPMG